MHRKPLPFWIFSLTADHIFSDCCVVDLYFLTVGPLHTSMQLYRYNLLEGMHACSEASADPTIWAGPTQLFHLCNISPLVCMPIAVGPENMVLTAP